MEFLQALAEKYPWLILLVVMWSIILKGIALWFAARKDHLIWFASLCKRSRLLDKKRPIILDALVVLNPDTPATQATVLQVKP